MQNNRALWEEWSDDFQAAWNAATDEGDLPPAPIHYGHGFPEDERLAFLPPLDGLDVIELGCGGGQASVGFARHDVGSVLGVDLSGRQLAHARSLAAAYEVEIDVTTADVNALPVSDDSFDLAFSSWVFQMVSDLEACFAEAARVLRSGGTLVFAIPHPFYELFDPESGDLERSYFETGPERKQIGDLENEMIVYNHRVSDVIDAVVAAGFELETIREPGSADPADYDEHWSHKPDLMAMVPPTLVVRAANP